MLKNYFQLAFRSLRKNKTFSFINIFGLAIGLCSCLLILAFVTDELSYDRYPDQPGDIYRVGIKLSQNGGNADYPDPDVAVGPGMKNTYPEVLQFTRLKNEGPEILSLGVRRFKEQHLAICDSNFLQFFSIPLIEGDQNTALVAPFSMVISREMAKRYFGSEDPLGKTISAPNRLYKITGVFDNIPDNRHFHFDAFISTQTDQWIAQTHTWSNIGFYTYLMMRKGTDSKKLEARFPELVRKYIVPEVQHDMGVSQAEAEKSINSWHFYLMPVSDIHLKSHTKYELEGNGDLQYVYIFGALAIFIVLLACVNFTNLATAGATRRSREVGIRKVLGSLKNQLISQFLTESIFQTACAMILAFGFVWLLLPAFNLLSGKHISILFFFQPRSILILIGLILAVGILAGIYPAFFLSSFHIIQVLKGSSTGYGSKKQALRSGLVVFQFMISTALMIGTIIVYKQLYYMQNKKLGFDRSQVLQIQDTWGLGPNQDAFKQQLLRDSRVSHVTISRDVPVDLSGGTYDGSEVYAKDKGANESGAEIHSNFFHVDYDYLSTLGMKIVAGRNFSRDFSGDSSSVVINESAVRDLGWKSNEDALDKIIISSGQHRYTVIGVVQDFNYASAKLKIAPVMMMLGRNYGSVIVKINTSDVSGFLADAKKAWMMYNPGTPFAYTFLDDRFASLYTSEQRTGEIFSLFAAIAILIACLGLSGLVAFTTQQRTKEIGVRKVLGASVRQVLFLLSGEYLKLVLIAFCIAAPLSWWAMRGWLNNFAYRITIGWWVFTLAGVLGLFIAVLTLSYQTLRASLANPVDALRTE